VLNGTSSGTV